MDVFGPGSPRVSEVRKRLYKRVFMSANVQLFTAAFAKVGRALQDLSWLGVFVIAWNVRLV